MNIKVNDNAKRLDSFLVEKLEYSRSKIQKLIKDGTILVNDNIVSNSYLLKVDDLITIGEINEEIMDLEPENIPLDIIYEDEYLAIINKPSGMVVHPAPGNYSHTLVNALLYHFNSLSSDKIRPGIVHRLDKDTSGLLIVAKNDKILEKLSALFSTKKIEKKYLALVWGIISHEKGTIDAPIGRDINNRQKYAVTDINSKEALTHFKVLKRYKEVTLVELTLVTGRTHQIRVHLDYIKHPVVNDKIYGNKKIINPNYGQMLHAKSLRFVHPITKKELNFLVDVPKEFNSIINEFDVL